MRIHERQFKVSRKLDNSTGSYDFRSAIGLRLCNKINVGYYYCSRDRSYYGRCESEKNVHPRTRARASYRRVRCFLRRSVNVV